MNNFDDENRILELFQGYEGNVAFLPEINEESVDIYEKLHDIDNWSKWIDSSGKKDPPPDFYSDAFRLMMDVMRIDDHAFVSGNNVINLVNTAESKIQEEIEQSGLLEALPNIKNRFVIPYMREDTEEDHNYTRYYENFKRTIEKHNSKINRYKNNHPNFKTIFFVMDESSAYCEVKQKSDGLHKVGDQLVGKPHFHYEDKRFIDVIKVGFVFLIWRCLIYRIMIL